MAALDPRVITGVIVALEATNGLDCIRYTSRAAGCRTGIEHKVRIVSTFPLCLPTLAATNHNKVRKGNNSLVKAKMSEEEEEEAGRQR